jgi:hypothetical protein
MWLEDKRSNNYFYYFNFVVVYGNTTLDAVSESLKTALEVKDNTACNIVLM